MSHFYLETPTFICKYHILNTYRIVILALHVFYDNVFQMLGNRIFYFLFLLPGQTFYTLRSCLSGSLKGKKKWQLVFENNEKKTILFTHQKFASSWVNFGKGVCHLECMHMDPNSNMRIVWQLKRKRYSQSFWTAFTPKLPIALLWIENHSLAICQQ